MARFRGCAWTSARRCRKSCVCFFFSSRRRHTRCSRDWSSDVCSSDLAQVAGGRTAEQIRASYDAHHADFDYLLGDWEFTAVNRQYGTIRGFWSAVRLDDGQVLDEYRVVGDSGQTYYVTKTLRAYNAVLDRWELVSTEGGTGLQNVGTGQRVGSEMHIEQKFGVMSPNPSLWRIRYYDIRPERFSWSADRPTDDGRTWTTNFPTIHARHAAEVAEAAAAQGKFWQMHDLLYQRQAALGDADLVGYARELGLDAERVRRELANHTHAARVREDFLSGVRSGVSGTPRFFINGRPHEEPGDAKTLAAALRRAL